MRENIPSNPNSCEINATISPKSIAFNLLHGAGIANRSRYERAFAGSCGGFIWYFWYLALSGESPSYHALVRTSSTPGSSSLDAVAVISAVKTKARASAGLHVVSWVEIRWFVIGGIPRTHRAGR